jgi:hypothetical protein
VIVHSTFIVIHDDGLLVETQVGLAAVGGWMAMRRSLGWRLVEMALLLVGAYALWRVLDASRGGEGAVPTPLARPRPDRPPTVAPPDGPAWVEPTARVCPASHPVKAKLASGIYHQPAGASYERTVPDRCYRDGPAAQGDGLRPAKR